MTTPVVPETQSIARVMVIVTVQHILAHVERDGLEKDVTFLTALVRLIVLDADCAMQLLIPQSV